MRDHPHEPNENPNAPESNDPGMSRRSALRIGATLGSLVAMSGVLGACGSSTRTKSVNRIGDPLPPVADFKPSIPSSGSIQSPAPIQTASASLRELPSFVIPRTRWTTGTTRAWLADAQSPIRRITIHHDAISPSPSGRYDDSVRRLIAIRNGHLSHKWADIGYHYAIDPAGRAWQARPLTYQGAHVKDQNPGNIGIVMMGNYEQATPTPEALETLNRLITHEMSRFRVALSNVRTHRELAPTACPGRNLQLRMDQIRRPGGTLASAAASMNLA